MKNIMKRKDIILIIVILIVAGMGFGAKSLFAQKGGEVIIKVDGKDYGTYPLNEDKTIDIDKLCIKQGKIDSNGQKIVCLPNKTVVEISSEKESEDDVQAK